jgi:hypothetical protein
MKEPEIGKGSSLGTARKLEYAPRVEPVIKTTTKKVFVQPPTFGDTEASIGSKVALPKWGISSTEIGENNIQSISHTAT